MLKFTLHEALQIVLEHSAWDRRKGVGLGWGWGVGGHGRREQGRRERTAKEEEREGRKFEHPPCTELCTKKVATKMRNEGRP